MFPREHGPRKILIPWVRASQHLRLSMPRHWGTVAPLEPRRVFPQGPFRYDPEGWYGSGVGDESKGQILCYSEKSGRTKVLTPLTEHVSHLKDNLLGDRLQIPFDTPDVTFRSGQHGPLERDWFRAKSPYTSVIYKNCHGIPMEL